MVSDEEILEKLLVLNLERGKVTIMLELNAVIICPQCGFEKQEQMLPDT